MIARAVASAAVRRASRSRVMGEGSFVAVLLAPAVLVMFAFTTLPVVYLIWTSLHTLNPAEPFANGFVGAGNFTALVSDPRFWNALRLTGIYTVSTVILQLGIGLGLALLVTNLGRAAGVLRVAAILPMILAPVVVGLIWRTLLLTPQYGVVDFIGLSLGLGSHNWLGNPTLALISVIAMHTWQWTPFAFLVFVAALASLPRDPFEAAVIDRASAWQRFRYITLPLIRPAIVIVVILRTIVALSAFEAIFAVTGGGPGTATEILNLYAYNKSFIELSLGYGASLAVVLLAITMILALLLFRLRTARR
jgi:multiple sugar transport system permease protein